MKPIDRLHKYIVYKGISLNAFDKSISTSNGYIGKQIKNEASIGGDILEKISCTYTDLDMNWLISGKGQMIKSFYSSENIAADPESKYGCKLCNEKDKRIQALERFIETQAEFIDNLKKQKGSSPDEQKRKVG